MLGIFVHPLYVNLIIRVSSKNLVIRFSFLWFWWVLCSKLYGQRAFPFFFPRTFGGHDHPFSLWPLIKIGGSTRRTWSGRSTCSAWRRGSGRGSCWPAPARCTATLFGTLKSRPTGATWTPLVPKISARFYTFCQCSCLGSWLFFHFVSVLYHIIFTNSIDFIGKYIQQNRHWR